jgi:putative transposase
MTRLELEARRMQAIPDLDAGMMQAKIARRLGVSRTTVSRWKHARTQGSALKRSMPPGRPPRLNAMDIECCKSIWRSRLFGWTQAQFSQAIKDRIGVEYHPDHVGKLMHKWGLIPNRKRRAQ